MGTGKRVFAIAVAGWLIYALFINPVWADYRVTFEDQVRIALCHLAAAVMLWVVRQSIPRPQVEDSDAA